MAAPTDQGTRHADPTRMPAPDLVAITPATRRVLEAIRGLGARPMVVGGSVRDALMDPGTTPKDIDIEVYRARSVDQLATELAGIGRVDEVGKSFGVLKVALPGGTDLDISLPRRDSKTGTGHRGFTVTFDPDISEVEATGRRDFTVNALMWDPATHEVVDHWGGLADLDAGVLRHCTDAFADDPLRVLRGAQFAARFGFTMAEQTAALCRTLHGQYADLATERVWGEWAKMLAKGRHFPAAIEVLQATGWLEHFPELAATRGVPQDPLWHPEGDVLTHLGLAAAAAADLAQAAGLTGTDRTVVVAAALLHDLGKATHTAHQPDGRITSAGHAEAGVALAHRLLERLGAPGAVVDRVLPIIAQHMCATSAGPVPTRPAVRRLARRLAPATLQEWSLVCGADQAGRGPGAKENNTLGWLAVARDLGVERAAPPRLLRGEHLMELGHRPSAAFRVVMDKSLDAQDDDEFTDETGALAWLSAAEADGRLAAWLDEGQRKADERWQATVQARAEAKARAKADRAARRSASLPHEAGGAAPPTDQ